MTSADVIKIESVRFRFWFNIIMTQNLPHYPFPHLENFSGWARATLSNLEKNKSTQIKTLRFYGTVKIHGTNTAVVEQNGALYGQGHSRVLTPKQDPFGFSAWYTARQATILQIMQTLRQEYKVSAENPIVLYGEFAGPKIQKGVAISRLKDRGFFIFACRIVGLSGKDYWPDLRVLKNRIENRDRGIYNLCCFPTYELDITLTPEGLNAAQAQLEALAGEVEMKCPVAEALGLVTEDMAAGEGIVFACRDVSWFSNAFKIKGPKFSENKNTQKTGASVDAKLEWTQGVVTPGRMVNVLSHMREVKTLTKADLNPFVVNLVDDILLDTPEQEQASALKLTRDDLIRLTRRLAADWFKENLA
jgi:hypothetical protein